ncbi:MAG TPA: haloacid dehalogenase type II [Terriglobales bacterium]|jgi:2-haloacid dehalogenase|nr:haloacid dehalogenase type II [Terriglobales bacterium]
MPLVLGFDVYGTLVDPFGIEQSLGTVFGDPGSAIAALWRQKQLEYSFRRGLMRCYEDFDACIDRALTLAARTFKVELSDGARRQLLTDYLNLPAFCDVLPALETLKASGFRLLAFSNGVEKSVRRLLGNAGVLSYFEGVVSVDGIKTFKPNPDAYAYLVSRGGCSREETWLISSNPFDVIGAKAAHLKAAWVKRNSEAVFDPWEFEPDIVVGDLTALAIALGRPA